MGIYCFWSFRGNVYNINGQTWIGCQIRKFEDVLRTYTASPGNRVAVRELKSNPLDNMNINELREKFSFLIGRYNEKPYVVNAMQLFAAMFPTLRMFRNSWGSRHFIFCSELVAIIYKEYGIIRESCNPANVVPADFYSKDEDGDVDDSKFEEIKYLRC